MQRSVHNLAQHLARRGHDVSIAAHAPGRLGMPTTHNGDVPVLGLNVPDPFTFNPIQVARRYAFDLLNVPALLSWCREHRIQIVHCHLVNADTRYALVAARRTGAKIVVTLRGGETEHWLETHPKRAVYVRNVLEHADWVTAVAQGLLTQARALVPAIGGKSSVVPNGIVPADLVARAEECRPIAPTDRPYVLFVGRLETMKAVDVLIDAFAFASTNPTFTHALVIAGSGSLASMLAQRARGVVGDRITFVGSTTYPESLRLIRDAAVLALPSISSEGCPNVVLEAMALGTPVVVSDLASLRELVGDGEAGAIFQRGDARALAQRLVEVTSDASLRERYVQAARARLDARHRVDDVVAQYERVYARVIKAS